MIFKRYFIFLLLIVACSVNNDDNETYGINFGSDDGLDIVTWNLEFFPKHQETLEYLLDFIPSINSDIYALQEISNQNEFNKLVNELGPEWVGFRSDDSDYQELSYIVNANFVDIITTPYSILEDQEHFFAYRAPYVLEVNFNETKYIIINVHYKCCGNGTIESDYWDEEYRRQQATYHLKSYIDNNFSNENVVIVGDFNDDISEEVSKNVFYEFLNDPDNYFFTDTYIAEGSSENWSFPSYPSHLDHILVTNELFIDSINTFTIKLDDYMIGGFQKYDNYISDHRPVGINL
ncbi:MAG: hypothetical protein CBE06_000440 [Pelagibacteraceae bacterium TMED246]|nr:MAG: hypothetical protein CBE06_000440 [Pelagibacteraceae bacterium TMED246]